ncbi:ABC transporter ATP-binding protein [Candidatus Saccharibacteria bacterium]|nr:ABC transporter ATP-binding protein [Candidatus Saccharibacteria bacterium]
MAIIDLKDVSKLYGFGDAATVALEEVTLSIEPGEFVAIMGPSGSGKTTLMNIIGLLDHPTHGDYSLNSRNVSRLKQRRRAKVRRDTIGYVFQSFNLLPRLTVLENVALPLAYKGTTKIRRLKRAVAMLERIGLADREYFMPRHLSGGQAQRVAIARALINDPNIIIADEPTGNLDSASSRLVMELLSDIHKAGNTVLLVTHNPALTRYASRVVFMQDGSVVADEHSEVGEMPVSLRRSMYFMPKRTVTDDLKGVSALMEALPGDALPKATKTKKKAIRSKTYRARTTKRGEQK